MSRTKRNHINDKTGKLEKINDNKPRCQCCCNPRHSAHGNKKEKLTMQERKEEPLEIYSDERLAEFAEGEAELERHEKYTLAQIV
mgnify:CR=1 FL=1|jgi:hypothetical protein